MLGYRAPDKTDNSPDGRDDGIYKVAAVIEYDGTNYYGFQRQARESTIQAGLELVLNKITRETCSVIGSGRTDSGVHARGQVVHFKTSWRHSPADLLRAMNALLPKDICVRELTFVSDDFHARYSAVSRFYRYRIFNRETRSPLAERFAYWFSAPLDVDVMNRASEYLIGTHDFCSFGRSPSGGHTVREVYGAYWQRQNEWLLFDIEANGFLRSMVRSLVGTLLLVGSNRLLPEEVNRILQSKDRDLAGPTAPPQGLCLEKVCYRPPWQEIGLNLV